MQHELLLCSSAGFDDFWLIKILQSKPSPVIIKNKYKFCLLFCKVSVSPQFPYQISYLYDHIISNALLKKRSSHIIKATFLGNFLHIYLAWVVHLRTVFKSLPTMNSPLLWGDNRELSIHARYLLIHRWLTQLWQDHVSDCVNKKYLHFSRVSYWSTGWKQSFCCSEAAPFPSCSRGHCDVTLGACGGLLLNRIKSLCKVELHTTELLWINFKNLPLFKGIFWLYNGLYPFACGNFKIICSFLHHCSKLFS